MTFFSCSNKDKWINSNIDGNLLVECPSVKDDFSALFVVEKEGRIVAGSLVWQAVEDQKVTGVCFDSVEGLSAYKKRPEIFDIYRQVCCFFKKQYENITFGKNPFTSIKAERTLPIPSGIYTDAKVQFLLDEMQNQRD